MKPSTILAACVLILCLPKFKFKTTAVAVAANTTAVTVAANTTAVTTTADTATAASVAGGGSPPVARRLCIAVSALLANNPTAITTLFPTPVVRALAEYVRATEPVLYSRIPARTLASLSGGIGENQCGPWTRDATSGLMVRDCYPTATAPRPSVPPLQSANPWTGRPVVAPAFLVRPADETGAGHTPKPRPRVAPADKLMSLFVPASGRPRDARFA